MTLGRWKHKLATPLILSADDGARVFFPFGPLRGYVLPKGNYESIVGASQFWFTLTSIGLLVAIAVMSKLPNLQAGLLICFVWLCLFVGYCFRMKRIARHLVPLPQAIAMRVYARGLGSYEMWKRVWFFVFAAAISGPLAYAAWPSANCLLLISGAVFFILNACVFCRATQLARIADAVAEASRELIECRGRHSENQQAD